MAPDLLADETVALVGQWLAQARAIETADDRALTGPLRELIEDPDGVAFTMRFVDRVARPDSDRVAAHQLATLVTGQKLPSYLSLLDRTLLRLGARAARFVPGVVIPLARRRMRQLVGHLVVDAEPQPLAKHLESRRSGGFAQNVNLLGEAVLGEREADRRLQATTALIDHAHIDYVSVKLSAVASQLNYWDWDGSLERVTERLRTLLTHAAATTPPTFINLDMEEYHDLELTVEAFTRVLSEPAFRSIEAGIVLQAYLPDSFHTLQHLVEWSSTRAADGGAGIKIRLVKGANLAMERVDAAIHGWEQAPYRTKLDVDANYKRCLDWLLRPERMESVRLGLASHNLFDIAWTHLLSRERGVAHRVEFEMLQGMAPAQARVVKGASPTDELLLYTPIVARHDFDVAISYLFRRLEENSAEGNFMRVAFSLESGSAAFEEEVAGFRAALSRRDQVFAGPHRAQQRPALRGHAISDFVNEPDTDPALPQNRAWAAAVTAQAFQPSQVAVFDQDQQIDHTIQVARSSDWAHIPAAKRRDVLHDVADEMARRRGDLINAMIHEGRKTFAEADPEVSEAIDFARYYGDRAVELNTIEDAQFSPLGVIAVIPPWNFPVAIPAGGVMAALAAGNAVIFKPSSQTPRCAEIVAECAWAVGVPADALQFVRIKGRDVGKRLVTGVDAVILTGSAETAAMFQSWKPDLRLFAETSGKNALVITPHADIDLAVADLVASAFGHAGQKCSAASLAICVGDVYESERFRRQLVDAVESLEVGVSTDLSATVGPTIYPVEGKLERALTSLEPGEAWLVAPERLDAEGSLWRPGVRIGVKPSSWFHQTECFGPVLGVMYAATLEEAIALQNDSAYGLTGGIHTLDPDEADRWLDEVEIGNAYVNRAITGAIVQRQPFGGWKESNVGPGAKAGGPNYLLQLGRWTPTSDLSGAEASDERWWRDEFSREHDPTGLFCEANIFRYRPLKRIAIRVGPGSNDAELRRVESAARCCGVETIMSHFDSESDEEFARRIAALGVERVRVLGSISGTVRTVSALAHVHLADAPVTANGRIELLHYLREQAVSRTLHRFGNLVATDG